MFQLMQHMFKSEMLLYIQSLFFFISWEGKSHFVILYRQEKKITLGRKKRQNEDMGEGFFFFFFLNRKEEKKVKKDQYKEWKK